MKSIVFIFLSHPSITGLQVYGRIRRSLPRWMEARRRDHEGRSKAKSGVLPEKSLSTIHCATNSVINSKSHSTTQSWSNLKRAHFPSPKFLWRERTNFSFECLGVWWFKNWVTRQPALKLTMGYCARVSLALNHRWKRFLLWFRWKFFRVGSDLELNA